MTIIDEENSWIQNTSKKEWQLQWKIANNQVFDRSGVSYHPVGKQHDQQQ